MGSCRGLRSSDGMTENNAIFCRRYLSLSERKYRRTSGFCRRTSAPAGDHKFLPPLFVLINEPSHLSSRARNRRISFQSGAWTCFLLIGVPLPFAKWFTLSQTILYAVRNAFIHRLSRSRFDVT